MVSGPINPNFCGWRCDTPLERAQVYDPKGSEMIRTIDGVVIEHGPRTRFKIIATDSGMRSLETDVARRSTP